MYAAARGSDPIPVDKNGTAYCLGYHIRGECWYNCKRHKDRMKPRLKSSHRSLTRKKSKPLFRGAPSGLGRPEVSDGEQPLGASRFIHHQLTISTPWGRLTSPFNCGRDPE
jgi:hypothetical protein